MSNVYLVSPTEVKTICPAINNEIDDALVYSAIWMVQNSLGSDTLTNDFLQDIYLHSGTTANKYLIDNYLKNILSYGVWQYLSITLSLQLNSSGLRIKTTDHSTAAELSDLAFIRTYIQNFIDSERIRMQRYINDNQSLYPLYFSDRYGDTPKTKNFRIGRVANDDRGDERCFGMDFPR